MTVTTTAQPTSPAQLKDFPDLLSPIVVKELRQALRGGGFVGLFCVIQLGLLTVTLLQLWGGESNLDTLDESFWFACVLALAVLVPLRAFNALAGEVRSDTFHLLQLTQLSSWRIAFGKWAATLALNALVAIGMLPFFVFRYFRGGVDLVPELLQLLVVAGVGAVVAAFTVAFSAHQAFLVRALAFSVIGLGGGMAVFGLILDDSFTAFPLAAFAWFFVGASWLGAYGLLMAAEAIATGDENYALTKRTIAMTAIVVSVTVMLVLKGLLIGARIRAVEAVTRGELARATKSEAANQ